ncbi:hypothetical protein [Hymenobacter canadensis]|uniref:Uncharacterized protein n=1 Tax=Hymenobacter canadensis TaxID=2999067 RepID=A0ABY7LNQ4_9BACT|nr:hypothetical protein [Hymenobacter canadensis]WBA42043.1 hypothetical protein O3303_00445 [Hymenobacter canadensis]
MLFSASIILFPYAMFGRIRNHLIRFARHQVGTISYLNLVQEAELGLNLDISHEKSRLNELLAEISEQEHAAGRPLLSCLVKVQGSKGQGDNFYKLCERLGMGEWRTLKQEEDFLKNMRRECRAFWQDQQNFEKHG